MDAARKPAIMMPQPDADTSAHDVELLDLGPELLLATLRHLGPSDLACVAIGCKHLRDVAADDQLWEPICRQRWHRPHVSIASSYRSLYAAENGWRRPKFASNRLASEDGDGFISAMQAHPAAEGDANRLAIANGEAVQLWELRPSGGGGADGFSMRRLASHAIMPGAMVLSLAMPSPGLVCSGDNWGVIEVLQQPAAGDSDGSQRAKRASLRSPAISV